MKKLMKLMAVIAMVSPVLTGCSDNKTDNKATDDGAAQTEQTAEAEPVSDTFDIEGLQKLTKQDELGTKEIDFILDQAEILMRKAEGMNRDEYNAFLKKLSKEDGDAVVIIALGLAGAEKSDKLTDKQKKRLERIASQMPQK